MTTLLEYRSWDVRKCFMTLSKIKIFLQLNAMQVNTRTWHGIEKNIEMVQFRNTNGDQVSANRGTDLGFVDESIYPWSSLKSSQAQDIKLMGWAWFIDLMDLIDLSYLFEFLGCKMFVFCKFGQLSHVRYISSHYKSVHYT